MMIDAHHHLWRIADRAGHWPPPDLAAIHRDFTLDDLAPLLAAGGVDGTVLVQTLEDEAETVAMLALAAPWEYHGTDFEADMAKMAADAKNQEWWTLTIPCQRPFESRAEGEWWAMMEQVFHHD